MHSTSKILSAVLATWAKPLLDKVLVSRLGEMQPIAAASEWIKKYFPVPGNYSIVADLAFLAVPATSIIIEPMVSNWVSKLGIDDDQIPAYAAKMADAFLEEASKNGKVTLFNTVEFEKSDFKRLKTLLNKNLPVQEDEDKYIVIE